MTEIIDIHPHIVSKDTDRYPISPLLGKRSDWSEDHSVTLEQMLASMDEAGVGKAALVHSSTTYGYDNSYVADAVAAHPDRLTGVFSIDILADDAVEKMQYWYGRGLRGLRIFSKGSTIKEAHLALDDPRSFPAWECAEELELPVCINVHARSNELVEVHSILKRFKKIRLILDHLGRVKVNDGPPYANAVPLFELAPYDNVFMKLTPRLVQDLGAEGSKGTGETFMPKVVAEFGASRIAFGSNYPASSGSLLALVKQIKGLVSCLSTEDQNWILAGTAKKLYPVLAKMPAATVGA